MLFKSHNEISNPLPFFHVIYDCFQGKPFDNKPMPQPVMLKKLKLNSSLKIYKNF